jgi:hypothetical protein
LHSKNREKIKRASQLKKEEYQMIEKKMEKKGGRRRKRPSKRHSKKKKKKNLLNKYADQLTGDYSIQNHLSHSVVA